MSKNSSVMFRSFSSLQLGSSASKINGGYDYDFIDLVPDRLICFICTKVMRDPQLMVCCGQKFCASCLQNFLEAHPTPSCPYCQATEEGIVKFQYVVEKGLKNEIESFHIKCSNHDKGCDWTGEMTNLQRHFSPDSGRFRASLEGCAFFEIRCSCWHWTGERRHHEEHLRSDKGCPDYLVQCPNKCQGGNTKVLRKHLSNHLNNRCEYRLRSCQYCREHMWNDRSSHESICPKFPTECPNICGKEGLVRETIEAHHQTCKYDVIPCEHADVGCEEKVRRQDMPQHMVSAQKQHLEMITKACKKLNEELEGVKLDMTQRADVAIHELKLVEQKYSFSLPLQLKDLVSSLKTQFKDPQYATDTELNFRMLQFQEVKEAKIHWRSPKFQLFDYVMHLCVKGQNQPNALSLELWSTIPESLTGSASSLQILVKVKKPSFKKVQIFFSGSLSNLTMQPPLFQFSPNPKCAAQQGSPRHAKEIMSSSPLNLSMPRQEAPYIHQLSHPFCVTSTNTSDFMSKVKTASAVSESFLGLISSHSSSSLVSTSVSKTVFPTLSMSHISKCTTYSSPQSLSSAYTPSISVAPQGELAATVSLSCLSMPKHTSLPLKLSSISTCAASTSPSGFVHEHKVSSLLSNLVLGDVPTQHISAKATEHAVKTKNTSSFFQLLEPTIATQQSSSSACTTSTFVSGRLRDPYTVQPLSRSSILNQQSSSLMCPASTSVAAHIQEGQNTSKLFSKSSRPYAVPGELRHEKETQLFSSASNFPVPERTAFAFQLPLHSHVETESEQLLCTWTMKISSDWEATYIEDNSLLWAVSFKNC